MLGLQFFNIHWMLLFYLSFHDIFSLFVLRTVAKNPSAYNLLLIAKALGVTLESILIDGEEIEITSLSNQQMIAFAEATSTTINVIIARELNLPLVKLITIIKEVYQYALKADPPSVDSRFVDWLLDKYKN